MNESRSEASAFVCEDVTVRFGDQAALAGVDLAIDPGEAVALVGPSGAGKTTLLRVLGGACLPSSGAVRLYGSSVAGLEVEALRRIRAQMGFVHQDLALVPNLRVSQNVLAGRLARGGFWSALWRLIRAPRPELEEVFRLLERVGIGDKMFQRTDVLSGGEQQRVAIARALYQEPRALMADEPVSSIDPSRARDAIRLLRELGDERKLTVVVSLHQIELAREFFPRLVGLREGRVVFDRPADEVDPSSIEALYRIDWGGAPL